MWQDWKHPMNSESMAAKRTDPGYLQVSGYIPKNLALTFKSICIVKEISISEAMEQMIQDWIEKNQAGSSNRQGQG